jgi:hypothetical protein
MAQGRLMMTAHHKKQIDAALRLYQDRGEFDGHSVAQARACLTRAGYEWKRDLAAYVKRKLGGFKSRHKAGQHIRAAGVRTFSDTGQTQAYVEWSDGSRTAGDSNNAHMRALLARAKREGVNVKLGEVF